MDLFALEYVCSFMNLISEVPYTPPDPVVLYMQRKENTKSKKVITQANFAGYLALVF